MKNARTHNKADSGALDKRDSTELVLTTSAEPRVDSRLLAKQLGGDHANVFELVTNYRADFEQLGVVRCQTEKPMPGSKGARPERFGQLPFKKEVGKVTFQTEPLPSGEAEVA